MRTNKRKEEVRARTTRTPTNRETSAQVRGYTDHFRVFSATSREDPRGITTTEEVTKARLLGYRRRRHRDPGSRPGHRNNPGRSRTSATSHDRAAATTQHLTSRANGDSANPRVREPIFPILRETTAKEIPTDHQEDARGVENGTTTAETRRPINDAPRGVRQQTPGSKREVRFHEARVNRGAVHAAVRTAMAELGGTPVSGYRDYVDGPRGGRNRDLSTCAIRARDPPQQCARSNPSETGTTFWTYPYHNSAMK